jgi:molybdopterin molybdotransferase
MTSLTPLATCLSTALDGLSAVPPAMVAPGAAVGFVMAEDICLPHAMPRLSEALRAGVAVSAMDLVGARPGAPVPLSHPVQVFPGDPLPPGADAVLPTDGLEQWGGMSEAIRPVSPGEGARRASHDGRAGDRLVAAGARFSAQHVLAAALAGIAEIPQRRPRVALALDDPAERAFVAAWLGGLGADLTDDRPDLTLRRSTDHTPKLALIPAETAWLSRSDGALVLDTPVRFDGLVTACLALALPALAQLSAARMRPRTLPLARKITSTVGLSELVLLGEDAGTWMPQPAGLVTLTGLASARAFAILPPESEGCAAGTPLAATPLDQPFG